MLSSRKNTGTHTTTKCQANEIADAKLDKLIGKVAEATREADLPRQWCLDNQNRLVRFA